MDELKYSLLVENSSDSFWLVDKNYKLISYNNSYVESTKLFYDISPVKGMSVVDFLSSEIKNTWLKLYKRALAGEHFSEEIVENYLGIQLCFDVSFNPVFANESITGVAVFSRDITARKNIEQELEYKINELNTFIYRASHDLRSPLTSILGLVQLAKNETTPSEQLKHIEMIGLSVQKMDDLLVDLVKIANVAQGKLSADRIDFIWMIDEIINSIAFRPEFNKIVFQKHFNFDAHFVADSGLLYSVLQNLIDNAVKYKRADDKVDPIIIIAIDVNSSQVTISITDNGIGIQENLIEKVFDMFYRGTAESNGTGLGLYIVKTSVEKMGGKVALKSIFGKGTSVNLVFPNKKSD